MIKRTRNVIISSYKKKNRVAHLTQTKKRKKLLITVWVSWFLNLDIVKNNQLLTRKDFCNCFTFLKLTFFIESISRYKKI